MPPQWLRGTLLSARWLHNWIGVFIGVILVLWVVSGLVMMLPLTETAMAGQGSGRPIDWSSVVISPAQAARTALAASDSGQVSSLTLQRLRDGQAYVVRVARHRPVLVDAATGQIVTITDTLAAAIAADPLPGVPIERVERIEQWGNGYTGPLPTWHVVFKSKTGTEAWVAINSGEVRRSERWDRLQAAWGHGAHVFTPLRYGPVGEEGRKGALWLTSIISLVSMSFGYWLALPARWRRRFG